MGVFVYDVCVLVCVCMCACACACVCVRIIYRLDCEVLHLFVHT